MCSRDVASIMGSSHPHTVLLMVVEVVAVSEQWQYVVEGQASTKDAYLILFYLTCRCDGIESTFTW